MHPALSLTGMIFAGLAGAVIWAISKMLPDPPYTKTEFGINIPRIPDTANELLTRIDQARAAR